MKPMEAPSMRRILFAAALSLVALPLMVLPQALAEDKAAAGKANANPCRDEVSAALQKLRNSSWFRMESTMITENGLTNLAVDYVLPDKMHQKVSVVGQPGVQEVILVGTKAWANEGEGWRVLPGEIASQLVKQLDENVLQQQADVGNYMCKGKVKLDGKDVMSYKLEDEAKEGAPRNEAYRMFYVDALTGMPVQNAIVTAGVQDKPLFKTTYSFPLDIKIEPPKDVKAEAPEAPAEAAPAPAAKTPAPKRRSLKPRALLRSDGIKSGGPLVSFSPWGEGGRRPDEGAVLNRFQTNSPLTPTLSPRGEGAQRSRCRMIGICSSRHLSRRPPAPALPDRRGCGPKAGGIMLIAAKNTFNEQDGSQAHERWSDAHGRMHVREGALRSAARNEDGRKVPLPDVPEVDRDWRHDGRRLRQRGRQGHGRDQELHLHLRRRAAGDQCVLPELRLVRHHDHAGARRADAHSRRNVGRFERGRAPVRGLQQAPTGLGRGQSQHSPFPEMPPA